ncbi:Rab geranylgeranyltransferase [Collariella sp. IMI 366227]|nr:Rab geranylgeranyltransferase [Collariella sp. IMI 366227]
MADQGGSQHGIARTSRVRTDEQRARDIDRIRKYRELEDDVRTRIARGDYSTDLFHLTSKLLRLNPGVLHDMERPQTLPNLWLILRVAGWLLMLEGVAEYFSYWHYTDLFRGVLVLLVGRDPARPRMPDSWEEWKGGRGWGEEEFLDRELAQIREALNVGPEDQSLWYYHQFLVLNIVYPGKHPAMTAGLTLYDRVGYLTREIEEIKELLEDYDDVKLIYEALFEYTLYLCELEGRKPNEEERGSWGWLGKLKKLDPMRNGRWEDLERKCGLEDS